MTTSYTSLLGLALPVTGELSGTWGDTVNNGITSLLDSAIAGTTTLSTDADVTLTTTTGASNQSRQAVILWTANGSATRTITAPAQSKTYLVINASSSTQSIKLVGVGPTSGVTILKGETALCVWNGSDFIKASNTAGAATFTSVTDTGLTSGRVTYAGTNGLLQDSANLTFNGTTLTANTIGAFILSGNITQTGNPSINIGTGALIAGTASITGTSGGGDALTVSKSGGAIGTLTQLSATGYGLTIIPGANTTYDAFTINNAANTLNVIRMFGDGSATFAGALTAGATSVTTLTATSMITGTALTANGAVAYKSIARATTEDAQIAFYAANGSTLHGLLNGTANSLEWYDSTPTRKFRITSTTMEANSVSTTLTGGNGDQLYLDNTGQRYTQLHFKNNTTAKADIYWDNDTSTFNIRNIGAGVVAITGAIEGAEQTAPSAPAANGYRIFAQDNGAGKTQLMVIFASGAAQQIAIEP